MNDVSNQYWKGRLLGGYAGLKHTAKKIAEFIPKCGLYVEPFAGMASVAEYVKADKCVLNDMSEYIVNYLWHRFKNKNYLITRTDFEECIKLHDSSDTFFLIDPPWRAEHYSRESQSGKQPYFDRKPWEYYKRLFEMIPNLQGNWIVCGVADERQTKGYMSNHVYNKHIVESDGNVIFGKKARTLLVSNLELCLK